MTPLMPLQPAGTRSMRPWRRQRNYADVVRGRARRVMAHELTHVIHRDILIGTVAATIAGAISYLSHMAFFFGGRHNDDEGGGPVAAIVMMILAPIAAMLIQMAISRSREYSADEAGKAPRQPAAPCRRTEETGTGFTDDPDATGDPFNRAYDDRQPLQRRRDNEAFQHPPPMEERISRLESMRMSG